MSVASAASLRSATSVGSLGSGAMLPQRPMTLRENYNMQKAQLKRAAIEQDVPGATLGIIKGMRTMGIVTTVSFLIVMAALTYVLVLALQNQNKLKQQDTRWATMDAGLLVNPSTKDVVFQKNIVVNGSADVKGTLIGRGVTAMDTVRGLKSGGEMTVQAPTTFTNYVTFEGGFGV